MRSDELVIKLRAFLDRQTGAQMEKRLLRVASDLKDAVRDRVQTSGQNNKGRAFSPYTLPYANQRQKKGYQIRKVDYTRSGRLWGSILPELVSNNGETIIIEIGPKGRDNEVKLLGPGTTKPRKDGVQRGLPTLPSNRELTEAFSDLVEEIIFDFENTVK